MQGLAQPLQTADLDEARQIHSFAAGFSTVLQKRRDATAVQVDAAEVVLWAERRLGEFCRDREKNPGGGDRGTGDGVSLVPTLADPGISCKQSSRWQRIYTLPEPLFVDYLERARHQQKPATQAGDGGGYFRPPKGAELEFRQLLDAYVVSLRIHAHSHTAPSPGGHTHAFVQPSIG